MSSRTGDWIQTYTGRQFWPLDPRPEEIDISDIAHALSMQCRFSGHVKKFYSVGQHSVLVSMIVPEKDKKWALLHDASEAYLVDLPRPLKRASALGTEYISIEKRLMTVICERFGLSAEMPESVRIADDVMLMTEKRDFMGTSPEPWIETSMPLKAKLQSWLPAHAETMFIKEALKCGASDGLASIPKTIMALDEIIG